WVAAFLWIAATPLPRPHRMRYNRTASLTHGPARLAKLYFSYAAMNAGKSTILLQAAHNYSERGMRTLLFTAALDDRAGAGIIASRIGVSAPAHLFSENDDLFAAVERDAAAAPLHCVLVDEAQFLTPAQVWQLAHVADRLGIPVMCYGLRTDFQGRLFPGSAELLAIADTLRQIRTICQKRSTKSMFEHLDTNAYVMTERDQVDIGGNERYVSLCRRHWEAKTKTPSGHPHPRQIFPHPPPPTAT